MTVALAGLHRGNRKHPAASQSFAPRQREAHREFPENGWDLVAAYQYSTRTRRMQEG